MACIVNAIGRVSWCAHCGVAHETVVVLYDDGHVVAVPSQCAA